MAGGAPARSSRSRSSSTSAGSTTPACTARSATFRRLRTRPATEPANGIGLGPPPTGSQGDRHQLVSPLNGWKTLARSSNETRNPQKPVSVEPRQVHSAFRSLALAGLFCWVHLLGVIPRSYLLAFVHRFSGPRDAS